MKSMTAYAQVNKNIDGWAIHIVMRSNNFKYLDISVHNLPNEKILLEEKIKSQIQKRVSRGKLEVYVFLKAPSTGGIHVEEKIIEEYLVKLKKVAKKYNLKEDFGLSNILNLPKVIRCEEKNLKEEVILDVLKETLDRFCDFKEKEGRVVQKEMKLNVDKLKQNIKSIKDNKPPVSPEMKDDIDEEISLMSFYANKLEKEIMSKKADRKGKSIDFLLQEILRELNTSASKVNDKLLGALILESKNYLERIREQSYNVE